MQRPPSLSSRRRPSPPPSSKTRRRGLATTVILRPRGGVADEGTRSGAAEESGRTAPGTPPPHRSPARGRKTPAPHRLALVFSYGSYTCDPVAPAPRRPQTVLPHLASRRIVIRRERSHVNRTSTCIHARPKDPVRQAGGRLRGTRAASSLRGQDPSISAIDPAMTMTCAAAPLGWRRSLWTVWQHPRQADSIGAVRGDGSRTRAECRRAAISSTRADGAVIRGHHGSARFLLDPPQSLPNPLARSRLR